MTRDLQDLDTMIPGVDNNKSSLLVEFHTTWTVELSVFLAAFSVLSVIAERGVNFSDSKCKRKCVRPCTTNSFLNVLILNVC